MKAAGFTARLPEGSKGRALAVALLLVGAAVLWVGVVEPLAALYADQQDALSRDRLLQQRMEAVAASLPATGAPAEAPAQPGIMLLSGNSDPVAAAALQQIAQKAAATAGTSLTAAETLPAEAEGKWRRISLRLSLTANWPSLIQVLNGLTKAPVHILIDDVHLHSPTLLARPVAAPVQASFVVSAYRAGG